MLEDGVATRYVPGRNAAASPYRFELEVDPETWFLEDDGYELAVFHSHLSSPPRPSRTDVENIGLWAGRPYLIYTLRTGELAAWRIVDGAIEPLAARGLVAARAAPPVLARLERTDRRPAPDEGRRTRPAKATPRARRSSWIS